MWGTPMTRKGHFLEVRRAREPARKEPNGPTGPHVVVSSPRSGVRRVPHGGDDRQMGQAIGMLSGVDADVAQFARLFEGFLHHMEAAAQAGTTSRLKQTLDAHLGPDCRAMPIIS